MDQDTLFAVLIVGIIAVIGWCGYLFVGSMLSGKKRKLSQRLSLENRPTAEKSKTTVALRAIEKTSRAKKFFNALPIIGSVPKMLPQAWPTVSIGKFLAIEAAVATIGFLIGFAVMNNCVIGGGASVVAAYIPYFLLTSKYNARYKMLSDQLPEALDFLSRALRSGHSFSTGLQMVSEELPEPLSAEFRRTYDQHSLGQTVEDSLKDTAMRIGSTEFAFFVTTVCIQRQTGGDMSEVLGNISEMIRARIRLQSHVKSKTAEGRFTGYILVAFPVIMFFLCYSLNPGNTSLLLHGVGLWLLGLAAALCCMGLYAINKLTQIKV